MQERLPPAKSVSQTLQQILTGGGAIADLFSIGAIVAAVVKQDFWLAIFIVALICLSTIAIYRLMRSQILRRAGIGRILVLFVISIVIASGLWWWLANRDIEPVGVVITDPRNGTMVETRYLVQGAVSNPNSRVYVIVHPLGIETMGVIGSPLVGVDGKWQIYAYFPEKSLRISDQYELIAIAVNENFLVRLATGNSFRAWQIIKDLPRNTNKSNIVIVHQ